MMNPVQSTRSAYIKLSLFVFLFTFTWAASFGLYAIWLGDKAGLDGVEIGTVFAVNGVFAVIIKPVYGYIMDKMGMKKHLLYFVCIVSALMAPFYIWCYLPLLQTHFVSGMIVGALFFSLGWYAGVAAEESYVDRFSRLYDMEFGRIRMWAALGWATASSFSGYLYNISPKINFVISTVSALCMFAVLLTLKVDHFGQKKTTFCRKRRLSLAMCSSCCAIKVLDLLPVYRGRGMDDVYCRAAILSLFRHLLQYQRGRKRHVWLYEHRAVRRRVLRHDAGARHY